MAARHNKNRGGLWHVNNLTIPETVAAEQMQDMRVIIIGYDDNQQLLEK